jgi:hypothetical protein
VDIPSESLSVDDLMRVAFQFLRVRTNAPARSRFRPAKRRAPRRALVPARHRFDAALDCYRTPIQAAAAGSHAEFVSHARAAWDAS